MVKTVNDENVVIENDNFIVLEDKNIQMNKIILLG